ALAILGLGTGVAWGSWTRACAGGNCPSIGALDAYRPTQALKIYAADGRLITSLGAQRRTVVRLEDLPPAVPAAFVAVEDKRFYQHGGVDYRRFVGALVKNVVERRFAEGFSTLTMQLARNVWDEKLPSTKSLQRKVREVRVALELERTYSKNRILELYLNQIFLGGSLYGVEAAAQNYFGKPAAQLNVAEAALIAGITQFPNYYDPRRHPDRALRRRNVVLNLMRDQGYLSAAEADRWKAYPVALSARQDFGELAPYFVEWVRQQVYARFGGATFEKGYRVYTTLDLDMQAAAERALEDQLTAIEEGKYGIYRHPTYQEYIEEHDQSADHAVTPYLQGAIITMEADSGYVRAMVGGRDFTDSKFNRAVQAKRQAGSTFKPFVFSAAVRAGIPMSYIVDDAPISRMVPGDTMPWEPQNYEGDFRGPMTIHRGLILSRNLVAIGLGLQIGEQAVRGEALRYGISTDVPEYPSMFIGSASVIPLEMVSAFTAFATLGVRSSPVGILRVEDENGDIVWQPQVRRDRVMDPEPAWLLTNALVDVVRWGTAQRAVRLEGGFTIPAGGKTGTTNDGTDVWFVGFTPELVTGVWIGLDQPQKIKARAAGGLLAAPAWTTFMKEVYERRAAPALWPRPSGLIAFDIDNTTGYRFTPFCPSQARDIEWFLPGTQPTEYCPVHSTLFGHGPGHSGGQGVGPDDH
ncbi:MAG TPA: PBP1A family penicillin-binding protein, partial [Gemmatimonadales bacterium]|nr:PBP1A family penicillin-binding protein [Gemmatimonadales bacterium]